MKIRDQHSGSLDNIQGILSSTSHLFEDTIFEADLMLDSNRGSSGSRSLGLGTTTAFAITV